MSVKIILLDLDGTLLNSDKMLSPGNRAALERAAAMGVHIVPATGRFYDAMPEAVRSLPFVRYAITVNGAQIYDAREKQVLHEEEISSEDSLRVYEYLDTLPGLCDCYAKNWGYMERGYYAQIEQFVEDPQILNLYKKLRSPVDDMRAFLREHKVQKLMVYFKDLDRRALELERIPALFPDMAVSSSMSHNIEINAGQANKGAALARLCALLGIDVKDTMAFGDGSNDLTMIRAAGIGVAMGNAWQGLKDAADYITLTNDEDGVARAIEKFVLTT